MKKNKVHIKVFITKNQQFRARITEPGSKFSYEVSVGDREWNLGKGRIHEELILIKCESLINNLQFNLENL